MNTKVDTYIEEHNKWKDKLEVIRSILLNTELKENYKWNAPVYTINNKNVLGLGAFKNHCGIWFFNGVFLKNEYDLLTNAQESTKAMRQMRFEKITKLDLDIIRQYVLEAIENQKNGLVLKQDKSKSYEMPEILQEALSINDELSAAFNALTFGKQKEYGKYILDAKQDKTKITRLVKIKPMIMMGIGLNEKYRKC